MKQDICTMPSGTQFTKFIMVITDAFATRFATDVHEYYKDHSYTVGIQIPGLIWSHAIYSSFLTGQMATNYNNDIIRSDHIIQSIKRTELTNIKYIGKKRFCRILIFFKVRRFRFSRYCLRVKETPCFRVYCCQKMKKR